MCVYIYVFLGLLFQRYGHLMYSSVEKYKFWEIKHNKAKNPHPKNQSSTGLKKIY